MILIWEKEKKKNFFLKKGKIVRGLLRYGGKEISLNSSAREAMNSLLPLDPKGSAAGANHTPCFLLGLGAINNSVISLYFMTDATRIKA